VKIIPLAFDSLGTRSMSTFIETDDVKILIDPGVSLAPIRYSLPPHPIELKRMEEHWKKIVKYASDSEVLIITHYHYDHHRPEENLEIYRKKFVFIKHPTEKINFSQKGRAKYFLEKIKRLPKEIQYADGKEFKFGKTRIKFSEPVFHGTNPRLGFVIEVLIDDGKYKFIHTSDVEGPSQEDQTNFILENKPNLIFLDGPLSYMLYRFGEENMKKSVENMIKIVENRPEALIVDHHFLRDLKWKEKIREVFSVAKEKNVKVQTAAEFSGRPIEMLEAHRKDLYKKYPKMKVPKVKLRSEE
jgi:predicted metallo-beta-lactamase superfamily hydrolase